MPLPGSPDASSQTQFQQLFNASPLPAVLYARTDGRILDVNDRFLRDFELTRDVAIGQTGWELGIWCDLAQRNEMVARVRQEGMVEDFQARVRSRQGREFDMVLSAQAIELPDGPAVIVQGIDVSDRLRFEQRLLANESRYRSVVEGSLQGILIHQNERICYANLALARMFDYESSEELIGRPLWETFVLPENRTELEERTRRLLRGEPLPPHPGWRAVGKLGREIWVSTSASLIEWQGRPAIVAFYLDVTDRHRAEQALHASEARFRQLFENSPDAIFVESLEGVVLDVNPAACRLHGLRRDELIGRTVLELVPAIRREEVTRDFQRLVRGELDGVEGFSRHQGGRDIPVAIRTSRIDFGGQAALLLHVRDVTEQKRAEEALRNSEIRLRTLLEALDNVAVQAYEADGTITFWNKASERLYGYAVDHALGRDVVELLHSPATRGEERRVMAEALATGRVQPAEEVEVVCRDGRRIWVFASRVLHSRPNQPPEFFCFDVDITDRKRAEEELALRQAELLHAARLSSVGQMVAALSHEVAQPLSAIGNFAAASAVLLESNAQESWQLLQEYNQAISKQNQRCGAILERLRNFSRRSPAHRLASDLNHLLRESAELMAHELRREGVKLRWELTPNLPPVHCDRVQLEQVIVNLLANARDALRDAPLEQKLITVRSQADANRVVLEIEDRGCGLAPDVVPRLFEPFVTTKSGGMGIGLSISRTIVRDHGGQIEAAPGAHGGAVFRVRLPALVEQQPAANPQMSQVAK